MATLVVKEPAVICAIGHCAIARMRERRTAVIESRHPRACGWCEYALEVLIEAIEAFDFEGFAAREFSRLPAAAQIRAVTAAQAFEPEPEHVAPARVPEPLTPDPDPVPDLTW